MTSYRARIARVDRGAVLVAAVAAVESVDLAAVELVDLDAVEPVAVADALTPATQARLGHPDQSPALRRIGLDRDGLVPDAAGDRWAPTVGDYVVIGARDEGDGRLTELEPRRTALVRDSAGGTSRTQALAANIDVVIVAEHLDPEPDLGRIERLLTLAWRSGARPVVVLTKADLAPDAAAMVAEVSAAAPGVEVVAISATAGTGLAPLRAIVAPGVTLVVVGPSGAGKSTLVNALAGAEVMAVGGRRADGRGRHTTTHRELITLPGGAVLIDTPGLRSVGVVADAAVVGSTFADVAELAQRCRFADCAHDREPGCAVREALESGALPERRFESWRRLAREAAFQARRADARLAAAEKSRWKQRTLAHRRQVHGR